MRHVALMSSPSPWEEARPPSQHACRAQKRVRPRDALASKADEIVRLQHQVRPSHPSRRVFCSTAALAESKDQWLKQRQNEAHREQDRHPRSMRPPPTVEPKLQRSTQRATRRFIVARGVLTRSLRPPLLHGDKIRDNRSMILPDVMTPRLSLLQMLQEVLF